MKPGKLRDNLIEHAEMARLSPRAGRAEVRRAAARSARRAGAEGHSRRAAARVPRASRLQVAARQARRRPASPTRRVAAPSRRRRCPRKTRRAITTATRRSSTRPRSTAGSPARGTRAGSRSIPRPTGVDATRAELVGVSLALAPNHACYIPLAHGGTDMFAEKPVQLDRATRRSRSSSRCSRTRAVLKIGQNLKYDMIVLARARHRRRAVSTTRS